MLHWYGKYSMDDILGMTWKDRDWFIDRLTKQAKTDAAEMRKGR